MRNNSKFSKKRLLSLGKQIFQRVFITIQFYDKKGLGNHAAGGAYGFLLSAAPTLLLVSIFLLIAFRSSPDTISSLIRRDIPFLETILSENGIIENIIKISHSGILGIVTIISIIWAGRVFALTLQRGPKVIFSGNKQRHPVKENLVTLFIQFGVFVFALVIIVSSQTAMLILNNIKFMPKFLVDFFGLFRAHVLPLAALGLISYCAYRIIPANPPQRLSALRGTLYCVVPYIFTFLALQFIISKTRYNFLYGALGDLIILLISVYFFFMFFYVGAQFAKVIDSLDVLLFCNLLRAREKSKSKPKGLLQKLFFTPDGPLEKYLRYYKKGDVILKKGDSSNDVFYLLDGQVEVLVYGMHNSGRPSPILDAGVFFGEMEHLLTAKRTATIRALTDISALALPPKLFDEALNSDTGIDRNVIKNLTRRLKAANDRNSYVLEQSELQKMQGDE